VFAPTAFHYAQRQAQDGTLPGRITYTAQLCSWISLFAIRFAAVS
jgi:hypothetical protein